MKEDGQVSDNRKYYYMRVKENFYETEDMKILQSMDNGYLYSDILMKLYLKSLKYEGRLMFKEHIPYNTKMIATITSHNIDVVEKALKIFKELNLIDILDNGAIYMSDIQNFIGETSTEADRIKAYRKKIKDETKLLTGDVQMYDECTPELELKKDININNNSSPKDEITNIINQIWKLYPNKKGKADSIKKIPKILKTISKENLIQAIENYKVDIENQRNNGFKTLNYMNGSTFFNGRYMDYLEDNEQYEEPKKENIEKENFDY